MGSARLDASGAGDLYAGLSLLRLRVFVAVVDHSGLSAAATSLDLGQPTISFHVKALERLLGVPLLAYRGRRMHPTTAGEELYRVASGMLRDAERLAAAVRDIGEGEAGQLHVGASMAFEVSAFFEEVVRPFRSTHPRVRLSFQFGHSVPLAEAVRDERLDLAYVVNWRLPAGASYAPLHDVEFVLMVGGDHPLARRERVTADDVLHAGLITAPLYSQEWPHYDLLLRAAGLSRYRVGLEIDGVQARILAARAGLGVMGVFVPPFAGTLAGSGLQPLRLPEPPPRAEFGVVSRDERSRSPAADAFASWLRQVVSRFPSRGGAATATGARLPA